MKICGKLVCKMIFFFSRNMAEFNLHGWGDPFRLLGIAISPDMNRKKYTESTASSAAEAVRSLCRVKQSFLPEADIFIILPIVRRNPIENPFSNLSVLQCCTQISSIKLYYLALNNLQTNQSDN